MKFVSKTAALGAAVAISATGLVAATGTTANAATVSVTYNCDLSDYAVLLPSGTPTSQPITAAYTVPALPTTLPHGAAVPAQAISADITASPVIGGLVAAAGKDGKLSGTVTGNVAFGGQPVAASLTIPPTTPAAPPASTTVHATGTLAGFSASTAGAQAVSLPAAVTATLETAGGPQDVSCTAAPGSNLSLGSVNVVDTLAVKAPKSVKAGHVAKLKVTTTATGKAVAKIKGKKVASAAVKAGKATLKVKKGLKKGVNKIVVSVGSLKQTVKVKVK